MNIKRKNIVFFFFTIYNKDCIFAAENRIETGKCKKKG